MKLNARIPVTPGHPRRFVFQGVRQWIDVHPHTPWGTAPRRNQLVFIGRDLDESMLRAGLSSVGAKGGTMRPLPVTVLTGFPDTLALQVLAGLREGSGEIRAVVPKPRKKRGRDASPSWMVSTTPRFTKLGKGCACCMVRSDLTSKVRKFTDTGPDPIVEHVVVVSPLHEDIEPIAKTFTVADEGGRSLVDRATLSSLVVAVDSRSLVELPAVEHRSLVERIELADVVVLTDASANPAECEGAAAIVAALNPHARVELAPRTLDIRTLAGGGPFDLQEARRRVANGAVGEWAAPPESRVARFGFLARRPFHPERLHALLAEPWPGILRGRGMLWVASQPRHVGLLDLVGPSRTTSASGVWWAAVPRDRWPQGAEFAAWMESQWHPAFGDRLQELTFIGVGTDPDALRERLTRCLLTDEELETPHMWSSMTHPFAWPGADA